ncbi:transmembrane protein 26 [Venturia canescens]|uniref:transmembrane protein 26 n=1 Tax=Venturia canescens TaxID=32260 RepID=UPI001C9C126E|nr:transmembrane protein 26 [Venturia canescens]
MAKFIATVKAIITRLVFASHGFIAIWQVTNFKKNPLYWYLSCPILFLFFEGIFTLTIKANQEWKWFCPSVFLYLGSVVPAIWLLELDKVDKRMRARGTSLNITDTFDLTNLEDLRHLEKAFGVNFRLPEIQISTETWVTLIEQFLMLILIIGRWMLPKGDLTRDQLSQLLLVYIGTAADIIEFFDSFKEDKIARETVLVYLTLGIWSWSLLQFTVVLTATKSRKSRLSSGTTMKKKVPTETSCCSIDVWGIALNMLLQDGPFLAFRLILIIHYQIVSYMNIFFTCKNTLVILLQLYRLYVVQSESKHKRKRRKLRNDAYEMPSISIISRGDVYKDTRGKSFPDERRRKHRRVHDIEMRFSNSEDSTEELDRYELSPRNLERSKRKTRQDTGYSTSSSRNSSKKDKLKKRESKKNSSRHEESTRKEDSSEDDKHNKRKKTEKRSSSRNDKKNSESGKNSVRIRNEDASKKRNEKEISESSSNESTEDQSQSESSTSESEKMRHGRRKRRANND